tara:strand:- start:579 stop:2831 length:2253 start_codon:yes stop_codon:yes gene_type:complete
MDEELDGINPNSFFEQLTEVRETAQSAQKISNSNLSLLNELRSKVEIISNDLRLLKNEAKDKAFEEEDRKQKEKLENRAKSIAGESQGSGEDIEKEQEDPEKGLLGQIGDFISNLFGGIVGGVAGLAISGIGGLIDLGTRAASSAKRIGTGIADALTFNMFDFDGKGKPDKKNLSSIMGGDKDYEKNRKKNLDLKEEIKGELKEELGIGDKLKETGKNILGGIKKTFGGIKDAIGNFDGRPGSRKTKNGDVKPEESFSTSIKYDIKGGEVDPDSLEPGVPIEAAQQDYYQNKINELQFEIRNEKLEFGDDANTSSLEEELKKFQKKYNDTLEFGGYDLGDGKTKEKKKNIFGFNFGGIVQGYNQGGEVDSVPAMLTPGEFVVTKDAVEKVGADTLKGLNASVGATNKASNLGSFSIERLDPSDLSKDALVKKSSFVDSVKDVEISNESGSDYFRSITDMSTGGLSSKTIQRRNFTEVSEDGTVTVFSQDEVHTEQTASIGVPDLIEHQDQLLGEIHKLKGFESVTIDQVINETTGIPQEKLLPILMRSDAQKATDEKQDKAMEEDRKARGIKPGQGFSMSANDEVAKSLQGTMGYRIGQINPDQLVSSKETFTDKTKVVSKTGVEPKSDSFLGDLSASINASVKGYNEGGLVGNEVSKKNISPSNKTELELIDAISQSVTSNSQSINIINQQNAAMDKPNNQPAPLAPQTAPNVSEAEVKDTTSPIPFVNLLRLNSQRYLNLGSDAMVIS